MNNKKRGIAPYPKEQLRSRRISVYVTEKEYHQLKTQAQKVGQNPPSYLRNIALKHHPKSIPELNQKAWTSLSKSAANLNQIAHQLNSQDTKDTAILPTLEEIKTALSEFRQALIGAKQT